LLFTRWPHEEYMNPSPREDRLDTRFRGPFVSMEPLSLLIRCTER